MTDVLVDTSVIIDCLRGVGEAREFIRQCRSRGAVLLHTAVEAEVIVGAVDARDLRGAQRFVAECRSIAPDSSDLHRSVSLLSRLSLSHGIGWHDCLVAATAMRLAAPVATLNAKHFRAFKGLKVIVPY